MKPFFIKAVKVINQIVCVVFGVEVFVIMYHQSRIVDPVQNVWHDLFFALVVGYFTFKGAWQLFFGNDKKAEV